MSLIKYINSAFLKRNKKTNNLYLQTLFKCLRYFPPIVFHSLILNLDLDRYSPRLSNIIIISLIPRAKRGRTFDRPDVFYPFRRDLSIIFAVCSIDPERAIVNLFRAPRSAVPMGWHRESLGRAQKRYAAFQARGKSVQVVHCGKLGPHAPHGFCVIYRKAGREPPPRTCELLSCRSSSPPPIVAYYARRSSRCISRSTWPPDRARAAASSLRSVNVTRRRGVAPSRSAIARARSDSSRFIGVHFVPIGRAIYLLAGNRRQKRERDIARSISRASRVKRKSRSNDLTLFFLRDTIQAKLVIYKNRNNERIKVKVFYIRHYFLFFSCNYFGSAYKV